MSNLIPTVQCNKCHFITQEKPERLKRWGWRFDAATMEWTCGWCSENPDTCRVISLSCTTYLNAVPEVND